jgi:HEAT repeat protein
MRLRFVLIALACVLAPSSGAATPRWPSWISEIEAGLKAVGNEPRRQVEFLAEFETPLIRGRLVKLLESPTANHSALELCQLRSIPECVPGALAIYNSGTDPAIMVAAMGVLALVPIGAQLDVLLSALNHPVDSVRTEAARLLGTIGFTDAAAKTRVRAALLAKLADRSANMRRETVESLGFVGLDPTGTLALTRVLEDADPTVRVSGAAALGRLRDPQTVPALQRALTRPSDAAFAVAALQAIAVIDAPTVVPFLLHQLDLPTAPLTVELVAGAIALRPRPEPQLLQGLVARLGDDSLRASLVDALLLIGEPAGEALRAAAARGLAAPVRVEVDRLLAALDVPTSVGWSPDPDREPGVLQRAAGSDLDLGSPRDRWQAAQSAAKRAAPADLARAINRITSARSIASAREWMVLIIDSTGVTPPTSPRTRARLLGWGLDERLAAGDRCLAIAAWNRLASEQRRPPPSELKSIDRLLASSRPTVRACTVMTCARRHRGALAAAFVDPDPIVRAAAALGWMQAREPDLAHRVWQLRAADPSAEVRTTAAFALASASSTDRVALTTVLAAAEPSPWIAVEREQMRVWLPAMPLLRFRWALAPAEH